jgi:hypothetical protein
MSTLRKFIAINCGIHLITLGIGLKQISENRGEFESLLSKQKRKLAKNIHPDVNKDGLNDMQKVSHFSCIGFLYVKLCLYIIHSIKFEFY